MEEGRPNRWRPEEMHARYNPQVADTQRISRATLLFMGPNDYVSPSWMSDRMQAPTWNYACVNLDVRMEFLDNHADLDRIVRDLVDAMEEGRPNRWRPEEMHARYEKLLRYIIPFRAHVLAIQAKFKLGQDEPDTTYKEIITGLRTVGDQALIDMMIDANPNRPG
jgi:transcriptional regulator